MGGTVDVWALRADIGITLATATDATAQVMIRSGGLISTANISITPKVIFGTSQAAPSEAIISTTANTLTIGDTTNRTTAGQIFATNVTKGGAGALATASKNALTGTPTISLAINDWNGPDYSSQLGNPLATDSGIFGNSQDRLLFTSTPGFGNGVLIPGITFNGVGAGMQVQYGSMFEIVPVPEPATTALLGSVALCALLGYRGRQRSTGIRGRLARK